jgi:hypothetical protein
VTLGKYVMGVLIGLDQWANTVLGGDPDETISSRAGKSKRQGGRLGKWLCKGLDLIDPGHCEDAIEPDEGEEN